MGSFEKLGILVIVVIITMILAVAIYQWGGAAGPGVPDAALAGDPPSLRVDSDGTSTQRSTTPVVPLIPDEEQEAAAGAEQGTWPGGIPKVYTVKAGDSLWLVVVKRWKLKDSFTDAIGRANPKVNVARLNVGDELSIPDPDAYRRGRAKPAPAVGTRLYEVQEGDLLGTIARNHLGSALRWKEIVELNPGIDPKRLRAGQKIRLPQR